MLRTAGFIGAAALAGLVTVLAPASANAATGSLGINSRIVGNPSGCIQVNGSPLMANSVANYTDRDATVFSNADCTGDVTGTVPAGAVGAANGASIQIG